MAADRLGSRPSSFPKILHNGLYTATFLGIRNEHLPGDTSAHAQWEIKRRGKVVGYMYEGHSYAWGQPYSSMNKLVEAGVQPKDASDPNSPDFGILYDQEPASSYDEALSEFARATDRLIKWREQHGYAATGFTPVGKARRLRKQHATKPKSEKPKSGIGKSQITLTDTQKATLAIIRAAGSQGVSQWHREPDFNLKSLPALFRAGLVKNLPNPHEPGARPKWVAAL